uniref:Uncharacterized protein n=1 Tax=Anguilla anguilla TaxID=7936 RepID=A0A0E9XB64_ANGAN
MSPSSPGECKVVKAVSTVGMTSSSPAFRAGSSSSMASSPVVS